MKESFLLKQEDSASLLKRSADSFSAAHELGGAVQR